MTKQFYDAVYEANHPSGYDGGELGMPERTKRLWQQTTEWLSDCGLNKKVDAKILEIGCGMAFLSKIHPGWHGAEYSKTAVERVRVRDGKDVRIFEEDAQNLTFPNEHFAAIFSYAALEHVPDPDKAFNEIDRVLQQGVFALIAPVWNCRSWTVKKIEQRPWPDLNLFEKLERVSIPIRENLLFRALLALPKRFFSELVMLVSSPSHLPLRFRQLHPRWDLIEKYGHVSDDDAVADIDPHAGILFFKSRGYKIISHPTFISRILARHEPLILCKNKS